MDVIQVDSSNEFGIAGQLFKSSADFFRLLLEEVVAIEEIDPKQKSALRDEFGRF